LAPFLWIFAQILYPPKIRKLTYEKMLENDMRRKILDLLEQREFEHFNALQKMLNSGVSITRWHLQVLEDFGKIRSLKIGQFKIFYLAGANLDNNKVVLYCKIRSKIALNIVRAFIKNKINVWRLKELSEALTLSQEIVSYHLLKLSELGLVKYNEAEGFYELVNDRSEDLEWLLKRYSFFN
ncbi:MAG: ArsR family transcriptional regulator, partial [Candidatus Hodarchaeales archaeon]